MGFTDDQNNNFGNGEVGGGRNWTSPVHGNTKEDGKDVTISLGQSNQNGHTLISDTHSQSADEFYARDSNGMSTGHAHFDENGGVVHESPDYSG